jgi:hypothetical protein
VHASTILWHWSIRQKAVVAPSVIHATVFVKCSERGAVADTEHIGGHHPAQNTTSANMLSPRANHKTEPIHISYLFVGHLLILAS